MELEDIRNAIKDGLSLIAIQRLADRRITGLTIGYGESWNRKIEDEMRWVACLHQAGQIADLNARELAEMVRDGLEQLELDDWLDEEAMELSMSEDANDAITNLLSDLRTL